jgi:hypothetical protein
MLPRDGTKGPGPDVEREERDLDPARPERLERRDREVERRGGGRDRSGLAREDRLVALAVRGLVGPIDVRRQGHVPHAREPRVEGRSLSRRGPEGHVAHAALSPAQHLATVGGVGKRERDLRLQRSRGPREHRPDLLPVGGGLAAEQQDFDLAPSGAGEEACRQDARVVRDQEIPGGEERGQLVERVMADGAGRAVEGQEKGKVARGGGMLRDPVLGKRVVEIRSGDAVTRLWSDRVS